ncbi:Caffeine resistance protein 5, partial [Pseudocercospora fuligena]
RLLRYREEEEDIQIPEHFFLPTPESFADETLPPSTDDLEKGEANSVVPPIAQRARDDEKDKMFVSSLLMVYTVTCYIGSSLYAASAKDITGIFGVSDVVSALGLSLYVLGYGVAPLLFGPLSEIPTIVRVPIFSVTYIILVLLSLAAALVNVFAGLLVLRFLLDFFAAPALANAGASYGDFFSARAMPYVICFWGGGATISSALGPLMAGFAVQAEGWRWSSWILFWFSAPVLILVLLFLPETSPDTILLRRARRLRALTGRTDLRSASEIKQAKMSPIQVAYDALIKPWQINFLDPAVLFSTIYTALTYGLYYSFFESFPLVYQGIYGFDLGQLGLTFLSLLIGLLVGVHIYCGYFYFIGDPAMSKMDSVPPEARLPPGLGGSIVIPIGLFLFAWTARISIHWSVSLIGAGISLCGLFIIVQCMLCYLPFTYPYYSGSLFAANGFARSTFAAGAILFANPLFKRLGIGGGVSLLAGLAVLCIGGMFGIYHFGATLRKRSRFAA